MMKEVATKNHAGVDRISSLGDRPEKISITWNQSRGASSKHVLNLDIIVQTDEKINHFSMHGPASQQRG